ncbi:uncharacterized protein N7484_004510 [Penicillium longicatenatum]|uniref:uncharacterized protein n=1 Tax=Penicillium longicatenatum TaxID=1561947 RepID=UPI002548CB90|nr:uncharacterized protein N7484_004510 [Penicillium longicatenatum]KAJ5650787.1 hypothetical protein N7484_004510 [Penicillium longicatenatum]
MAPVSIRQNHSFAPPRPQKGPSTKPIKTDARIDPIIFVELFAGTVGIFILSVLIWKAGNFIRSFTEGKVLAEGKSSQIRFAKTWYGWVTLETREKQRLFFRRLFARVREWTIWETPRTEFQWIWWDPGQEALQARRKARRRERWLPKFLLSYESPPADAIWNPGPRAECHGALLQFPEHDQVLLAEIPMVPLEENSDPPPHHYCRISGKKESMVLLLAPEAHRYRHSGISPGTSEERMENIVWCDARTNVYSSTASLDDEKCSTLKGNTVTRRETSLWRHSTRNEDTSHLVQFDGSGGPRVTKHLPAVHQRDEALRDPARRTAPKFRRRNARRHQIWAAKMQVKAAKSVLDDLRDSSGPPGTPITDMLASLISEQGVSEQGLSEGVSGGQIKKSGQRLQKSIGNISLAFQPRIVRKGILLSEDNVANERKHLYHTVPSRLNQILEVPRDSGNMWHSVHDSLNACARHTVFDIWQDQESHHSKYSEHRLSQYQILRDSSTADDEPSDWELKLIDKLDRKLIWVFNETTPGQKPYHFTLLANHWLNRETWVVIDPVSRVSNDARRNQGDPRYNFPYPGPDLRHKPKYPDIVRKKAYTPRIDCWRAAVNQQRRVSGVPDIIRPVELYEDSAEEPPDGHIDPACWILPKPPQGFEMSTKQKTAWYEGGAGWQEQLDDWQRVRRGYRLRKALFEGRVNRNRLKEVATNVNKYCRRASLKVINREVHEKPQPT